MMIILMSLLWVASLVGIAASLYIGQWLSMATMMMNLILATLMIAERMDK